MSPEKIFFSMQKLFFPYWKKVKAHRTCVEHGVSWLCGSWGACGECVVVLSRKLILKLFLVRFTTNRLINLIHFKSYYIFTKVSLKLNNKLTNLRRFVSFFERNKREMFFGQNRSISSNDFKFFRESFESAYSSNISFGWILWYVMECGEQHKAPGRKDPTRYQRYHLSR